VDDVDLVIDNQDSPTRHATHLRLKIVRRPVRAALFEPIYRRAK
jgi:hypothetical protein